MLKTASKLMHNWRCYSSSKCCKICQKHGSKLGVLLWHHPQRKTVIWMHNYSPSSVQLQQSWKIYFLYDFWYTQTCSFWAIFGLPAWSLTLAVGAM